MAFGVSSERVGDSISPSLTNTQGHKHQVFQIYEGAEESIACLREGMAGKGR